MERTRIIRRRLNGQWTVMDSSFLKSLTGTARACGTRDKSCNFTVHYCPLSRYKQISVTPVTPVTLDFLKVSRVLRTRIMRTGATRIRLHGTRDKFTHYSVTGVTVQKLYGWGWVEDVSKILYAYRARAVRMKSFLFYPTPTPTPIHSSNLVMNKMKFDSDIIPKSKIIPDMLGGFGIISYLCNRYTTNNNP